MSLRNIVWSIPLLVALTIGCSQGAVSTPTASATGTAPPSATPESTPVPQVGIEVGNLAPDFDFALVDGNSQSTQRLAEEGKPVFLFFFATW